MVRLHPSSTDPTKESIPDGALASPRDEPLLSALNIADIVVTLTSTVAYEALLMGKQVLVLRMSRFSHLVDYSPEDGALVIDSLDSIPEALRTLATSNPVSAQLRENRDRLPRLGGASRRVADVLEELARNRAA